MKKLKQALALLLTLALLLSMAAISEEALAPEQAGEPEPVEEVEIEEVADEFVEEEPAEDAPAQEEPEEESAEEPVEEPAEAEPVEELVEELSGEIDSAEFNAKADKCPSNPDGDEHEWGYDEDTFEPTGICEYCGAKCPHKDTNMQYWKANVRAEQLDETRHILYYDQMSTKYCWDCEVEFDNKVVKAGLVAVDSHWFEDDEGEEIDTCYYCGCSKSECKHEHTRIWCDPLDDDVQYKKIDAVTHKVTGYLSLTEMCEDCGRYLHDEEEGYYTDIIQKHHMPSDSKNAKCDCGFKASACKHKDCYIESTSSYTAYIVNYGNPTYHYNHYNRAIRICNICYNEKNLGAYDQKEEHVFKDGSSVCALCGYKVQAASIAIDTPAKTSLNVDETLNLTATISPANAVSERLWYSSNRAVATVSKAGVVTALSAGTTNITAKAENGKSSKALKLTVVDPRIPTKLTFPKTLSATLGDTVEMKTKLTALAPDTAELKWSSSKPEIVEINEATGVATMLDTGSAKISVTAATASGKGVKSASVTVTVTDPKAPSKITLSPSGKIKMSTDDAPKQITWTLNAEAQGTCEIAWSSSKPDVAQVDANGNVTAIAKGTAKITATASKKNNKGQKVTASVTVQVTKDTFQPTDIQLSEAGPLTLTTDSEPVQIVATVLPEDARSGGVTWKNSNSYAVKLDPATGTITPQAEGSATITITSKKKAANKKAIVKKITVNVSDPHAITSFALAEGKTKKLFLGDTLTLTPVFGGESGRSAVTYTAKKNKGIIDLDKESGEIKPLKEGKVEITATTAKKKGTGKKAKAYSAKITVSVVDPKRPDKVEIDNAATLKDTKLKIGQPIQLSCTVTAVNGQQTKGGVKWSVKDPKKALIDDEGNLYALKSGVTISVTATTDAKGADGKARKATISIKTE